jgi:hypothetical protein
VANPAASIAIPAGSGSIRKSIFRIRDEDQTIRIGLFGSIDLSVR